MRQTVHVFGIREYNANDAISSTSKPEGGRRKKLTMIRLRHPSFEKRFTSSLSIQIYCYFFTLFLLISANWHTELAWKFNYIIGLKYCLQRRITKNIDPNTCALVQANRPTGIGCTLCCTPALWYPLPPPTKARTKSEKSCQSGILLLQTEIKKSLLASIFLNQSIVNLRTKR